jgi:DNA-directed RNA polymerase subunit RPC12/RpoP
MYHYTACLNCGKPALKSTEPQSRKGNDFPCRCLHCGAEFTLHPIPAESERDHRLPQNQD